MFTPRKHLSLDVSALRVSALILRELKKKGVVEIERLRGIIIKRVGPDGELAFLPALGFLFLIGRIDYHLKNDTVEFKAD